MNYIFTHSCQLQKCFIKFSLTPSPFIKLSALLLKFSTVFASTAKFSSLILYPIHDSDFSNLLPELEFIQFRPIIAFPFLLQEYSMKFYGSR